MVTVIIAVAIIWLIFGFLAWMLLRINKDI